MNNSIHSLEYYKTEIEVKEKDYMKYKVGDKVKIREDLTAYKWYGDNFVAKHMMKYVGRIATIVSDNGNHFGVQLDIDNGAFYWTYEMFDQNWKEDKFMKTSEFKNELKKLGYRLNIDTYVHLIEDNATVASISSSEVNTIDTAYGKNIPNELFSLMSHYATTPIAERNDKPKLFNVQIIKGNWGRMSWLYRDDDEDDKVNSSILGANNYPSQQWTLAQIKEYGIDDETVYKRVPVEDDNGKGKVTGTLR